MRNKIQPVLTGMLCSLLLATPALGATYKWIDEDGNVVYSQKPPPEGRYESIRIKPGPRNRPTESKSETITNEKLLQDTGNKRKDDKKIAAEMQKNRKLRQDNCAKARKQLEIYTVYTRVKDDKGGYRRITPQEREAGTSEAKQAIKDFCD
ncbi:MAG: DUF4124 domain-containing protein [Gammaproteobacteria bacterium]|nr:DUF4124 domain-containing protein [Gammaproteobacteria bacterium]MDH5650950.1 DUF4124 domain-containing protein [Gammaproteobacteria bacterium]